MDILLESDQTTTFLLMLDGVFVEINDIIFPAALLLLYPPFYFMR